MTKVWRVFAYEYLRHVRRKRFLLAVLSMPLLVLVVIGVSFLSVLLQFDSTPVGYVDQSGVLANPVPMAEDSGMFSDMELVRFEDEAAASQALDAKEIQAYYVVEADYLQSGATRLVTVEAPSGNVVSAFSDFMRANLITGQPEAIASRLAEGPEIEIRSLDGSRQMAEGQWLQLLLPLIAGILFMVVINTSGGYLLQAVVEEKENRTIEIVVTSVSTGQLMAGKIIGNLSVGMTQLLIWISFPILAFLLARSSVPMLQGLSLEPQFVGLLLLTLLPAFILVSALMATVGATAMESREAQQIAGLFTLPVVMPFWFISTLMTQPNGPLAVGLSIFPLTAPVSLPLRAAFTVVPLWQSALSIGLLILSAAGALWLAGRAFRLGMLRYGQRLGWKELFGRA